MFKSLNQITIGILGGIGPESSAEFYYRLIKEIQQKFNICSTSDFPHIIINSIAIKDMVEPNIKNSQIKPILNGLKELDFFKPDFNAIICNSANSYYDYLTQNTSTEILNLRTIVKKYIDKEQLNKIGVLGTYTTLNKLYNYSDKVVITVPNSMSKRINAIIIDINRGKSINEYELKDPISYLVSQGAERIILGCTEIGLIGKNYSNTIDPMDLLLKEIIERISLLLKTQS